jgi:hypothetical protein
MLYLCLPPPSTTMLCAPAVLPLLWVPSERPSNAAFHLHPQHMQPLIGAQCWIAGNKEYRQMREA